MGADERLVSGKFLGGWYFRGSAVVISEVGMAAFNININVNSLGLIVVSVRRRHHV